MNREECLVFGTCPVLQATEPICSHECLCLVAYSLLVTEGSVKLHLVTFVSHVYSLVFPQATQRRAAARAGAAGGASGGRAGGSNNILQFYTDDSPGLQVGPTTVLVASLSFVGVVVLLHIWGKFRS